MSFFELFALHGCTRLKKERTYIRTIYTVQIIQPSEGHVSTQSADIELSDRIFSEKIFLGVNDSIDDWKEIIIKETEDLKLQQKRIDGKRNKKIKLIYM